MLKRALLATVALGALNLPAKGQSYTYEDWQCLAHAIYGEARGEPLEGQAFVGWSVLNRAGVNLREFGGYDICGVVYKTSRNNSGRVVWQYDGAAVPVRPGPHWEQAVDIAQYVLEGHYQPPAPVMYFCNPRVGAQCQWHNKATVPAFSVGGHNFYTDPRFVSYHEQ